MELRGFRRPVAIDDHARDEGLRVAVGFGFDVTHECAQLEVVKRTQARVEKQRGVALAVALGAEARDIGAGGRVAVGAQEDVGAVVAVTRVRAGLPGVE